MVDNADDHAELSEKSSDEGRHEKKKSMSLERSSCKKRRRIRVIPPHPAPAPTKQEKQKRNIRKGNPKTVIELNLLLQKPVVFA